MMASLVKKISIKMIKFKFNIDKGKAAKISLHNPWHKLGIKEMVSAERHLVD